MLILSQLLLFVVCFVCGFFFVLALVHRRS